MEHLRLFENYKSDEEIHRICKEYKIKNYTINKDGSIDVKGSVDLNSKNLIELPLTFNVVEGKFHCSANRLTTLKGSPRVVLGNFYVHSNNLTNLIGGPEQTNGYSCYSNRRLTSLEGIAKKINGFLNVKKCNLTDFRDIPHDLVIGGEIDFRVNPVYQTIKNFLMNYNIKILDIKSKYYDLIIEINELNAIQDGEINDIRMDQVLYNIGLI